MESVLEPETATVRDSMRVFRQLLVNTLVSGVTSSFLWFALTFWMYLETRSVVATGVIGGAFSLSTAILGPAFGTYVDHHRKHAAMARFTAISVACFTIATAVFVFVDSASLLRLSSPWFWVLVGATPLGSVAGQLAKAAGARVVGIAGGPEKCAVLTDKLGLDAAVPAAFLGLLWPRLQTGGEARVVALAGAAVAIVASLVFPAGVPVLLAALVALRLRGTR